MTELDAARQIIAGTLPSPWKLGRMTLFAIRITGTGLSYRTARDEYVWRDPSIYLNDEFLARCSGLPVIWLHPEEKAELDSDEYKKRSIGTVMLAYIKDEEVWAICRIYVQSAIDMMAKEQWSTSPAVVFAPTDGNEKIKLNGETFLIEGDPSLLDHICICGNGVWDKGRDPSGVRTDRHDAQFVESEHPREEDGKFTTPKDVVMMLGFDPADEPKNRTDSVRSDSMPEETKEEKEAREDRARKDAERDDRFDKAVSRMEAHADRMDAERARHDAEEKEREDRAKQDASRLDAARKDRFGSRKDGESYKDWKGRHDADEAAMMDALVKGGCEADRAKKDAADCRADAEEGEKKEGGEGFRKWAEEEAKEPEHEADKAKKDADEKAEKERMEADKRHDSQATTIIDLKKQLAEQGAILKGLTTEVPASERDALARAQSRADSVCAMFGDRAPTPMAGEQSLAYRKRLLEKLKAHSPEYKETRFDSADDALLKPAENIVYADAVNAAKAPAMARPGLLMPIVETDRAGRQITKYVGDPMAWMAPYMSQGASGRIRRNPNSNEGI